MEYFHKQYTETSNPYWLLFCFTTFHKAGLPVPKWVLDILCDAFEKNIDSGDSVDKTLGLKKKGRKFDRSKSQRDFLVFNFIYLLQKAYNMSVRDAITVITEFYKFPKNWGNVSPEYLENEYSKAKYSPTIIGDNIKTLAEPLFKHAPDDIKQKYAKVPESSE